jgi:hypothetical protein
LVSTREIEDSPLSNANINNFDLKNSRPIFYELRKVCQNHHTIKKSKLKMLSHKKHKKNWNNSKYNHTFQEHKRTWKNSQPFGGCIGTAVSSPSAVCAHREIIIVSKDRKMVKYYLWKVFQRKKSRKNSAFL